MVVIDIAYNFGTPGHLIKYMPLEIRQRKQHRKHPH